MAEPIKNMTHKSLQQVISCIDTNKSFILEAGAGSGKTWTLIESLKHIINNYSDKIKKMNQKIICITYTNVAKDEISDRIEHNSLVSVKTIHEFLWETICKYQKELKNEIIDINNNNKKHKIDNLENVIKNVSIEYSQYQKKYNEGKIYHDDVINLSCAMFNKYPKISKITACKFPYIFIDEYQDTEKEIVNLLLNNLLRNNLESVILGFFGDSMQKIYNKGVGHIESGELERISKDDNFRCSKAVINLLNKIRSNLKQIPGKNNLEGKIQFFHCNNCLKAPQNYETVINYLKNNSSWPIDSSNTKVLMLTHKGIASKLDYKNLLEVYTNNLGSLSRERLYEKEDKFSDFLFNKVEKASVLYKENKVDDFVNFIGKEKCKLEKHSDKERIHTLMTNLNKIRSSGMIRDVLNYVFENNIFSKPTRISDFEKYIDHINPEEDSKKSKLFYDSLMSVPYNEVMNLYQYIEDNTPFSTKHGVKGAEFDNVLVVIDDASWNQYNFNNVFCEKKSESQYNRTLNLLYMCCSRSKDKLALLSLSKIDSVGLKTLETWFGAENIYDVTTLS